MNKLNIVTTPESNSIEEGVLSIITNENTHSLAYLKNNVQINVNNGNLKNRPIRITELNKRIQSRDWNITERKYIGENDTLSVQLLLPKSFIDTIDISENKTGIKICNVNEISESDMASFREEYKSILENMDKNEIYLYNASNRTVDILNNSLVIDAILYNSDIYTNTLDLNFVLNNASFPKISSKVDLEVQYSKQGIIYSYSTTFEAFKYESALDQELLLNIVNFIEPINNELNIEYVNGIIKVLPSSREIIECIISSCTITYGNIN